MASRRQLIANRRNSKRSTGPRTIAGKLRSRRNALQHGLTGETVITVFEKAEDYEAFECEIFEQYRPQTAVTRQLVLRLCSLLWRLRRATAIETGVFRIQGEIIRERKAERLRRDPPSLGLYQLLGLSLGPESSEGKALALSSGNSRPQVDQTISVSRDPENDIGLRKDEILPTLAQSFMRVARLDNKIFDRLGRYETALWRQTAQVITMLSKGR